MSGDVYFCFFVNMEDKMFMVLLVFLANFLDLSKNVKSIKDLCNLTNYLCLNPKFWNLIVIIKIVVIKVYEDDQKKANDLNTKVYHSLLSGLFVPFGSFFAGLTIDKVFDHVVNLWAPNKSYQAHNGGNWISSYLSTEGLPIIRVCKTYGNGAAEEWDYIGHGVKFKSEIPQEIISTLIIPYIIILEILLVWFQNTFGFHDVS